MSDTVIVVLGFHRELAGGSVVPTLLLRLRLEEAHDQWLAKQKKPLLLLSGFDSLGMGETEAATMQRELIGLGVPPEQMLLEPVAKHTIQNALRAHALLQSRPALRTLVVCTNTFHLPRTRVIFEMVFPSTDGFTVDVVARPDPSPFPEKYAALLENEKAKLRCQQEQSRGPQVHSELRAHERLTVAARFNNVGAAREWLDLHRGEAPSGDIARFVEARVGRGGAGPLHYAALFGAPDVAAWLLSYEVGVGHSPLTALGATPLHFAAVAGPGAEEGAAKVAVLLIAKGANPELRGEGFLWKGARTAWELGLKRRLKLAAPPAAATGGGDGDAATPGSPSAVEVATPRVRSESWAAFADKDTRDYAELKAAAHAGSVERVKAWMAVHGKAAVDGPGGTHSALVQACSYGNVAAAAELLAAGANPNFANAYGATPLHYAALRGHTEVAALLLAHGASTSLAARGLCSLWVGARTPLELGRELLLASVGPAASPGEELGRVLAAAAALRAAAAAPGGGGAAQG
jgi:hypothetical protein